MGIVEVLGASRGKSPLIIGDLDVYPQLPRITGAPTLSSEEPKCRQIFFHLSPAIHFIVRDPSGLTTRTAGELLPFAYDPRAAERPQKIYMWEGYESMIRNGTKHQTIRIDDPFWPGPADLVFEKENGDVVVLAAKVTDVCSMARNELTDDDAKRDGFSSLDDLNAALSQHYPDLSPSHPVDVVSFELDHQ